MPIKCAHANAQKSQIFCVSGGLIGFSFSARCEQENSLGRGRIARLLISVCLSLCGWARAAIKSELFACVRWLLGRLKII
jgi:hypothetical protein